MSQPIVSKSLKPIEILAIDDDEWFLRLLIKKFADVDPTFHITAVSSVDDAVKELEEKVYDAILCDHKLPGTLMIHGKKFPCDGIHLLRKFKDEMRVETPFLFVTGQGSEEIASQALQLGAAGYFIKRVQPGYYSLMASSIRQIVDRYWLRRELKTSEARYRDLFENSPGLIFFFDTDGNLQESNQNFYSIFGYDSSVTLTFTQLAYKKDLEKWKEMISSIINGNDEIRLLRSVTATDQVLHLDVNARPIWDQMHKQVIGIQMLARDISDQVRTQQALIDSEEKHRKIVEGSLEGIIFLDSEGIILDWNPAAAIISGIEPEEALGKKILDIFRLLKPSAVNEPENITEPHGSGILSVFTQMISKTNEFISPKMIEFSIKNLVTTERRILESTAFIIEHSKGDRIAVVIRDVTERRITEAEAKSFAKRFQMLIEQTAIGVWLTDAHTELTTYVNESVASLLGYSSREIIGVSVLDFATPESAKRIKEKTQNRFTDKAAEDTYELDFFHRNGKKIQTLVTAAAIFNENGELEETYALIRDITEAKEQEKELNRTQKFLGSIIASMPSGVYSYDLDNKITLANPRLAQILGYTSESELIGRSVLELFPSYEHARVKNLIKERMDGQLLSEYLLISYVTRQGEEIKASITSIPLIINDIVEGAVVTVSDITDQRKIESYLRKISLEYQTLLRKLPAGIIKVDNLGKIITYNEKAAEILRFIDVVDMSELNVLEYHPFKEAGVTNKFRDLLYKKNTNDTFTAQICDKSGKEHYLKFFIFPIQNQQNETIAWFILINAAD
ncbi:MAG: PAS domain S-box protein [Candidatus Hodarchaeales archaeon]